MLIQRYSARCLFPSASTFLTLMLNGHLNGTTLDLIVLHLGDGSLPKLWRGKPASNGEMERQRFVYQEVSVIFSRPSKENKSYNKRRFMTPPPPKEGT